MRVFILVFLMFSGLTLAHGQDRTFDAGAVLGFNMSQIDGDDMGGPWVGYRRLGIVAGGRVQFMVSERWQLGLEILYSQLGSSRGKFDVSEYDNIRLNCVNVPVTVSFLDWADTWEGEDFYHIGFNAGLTYSRIINYEVIDFFGGDITEMRDLELNMVMYHLGFTYNVNPKYGFTLLWTKGINDFDKRTGPDQFFLSRQITLKGMYYF
jgi:hypothetical protein